MLSQRSAWLIRLFVLHSLTVSMLLLCFAKELEDAKLVVLDNGVRLVMRQVATSQLVAIGVWVRSGSADEPEGAEGVAHLLEHLIFRSADPDHSPQAQLEALGGYVNGETSRDFTNFHVVLSREHAEKALTILAQAIGKPSFRPEDVSREKTIVDLERIEKEEDSAFRCKQLAEQALYGNHPYARPPSGTKESLKILTEQQVRDFYSQHYRPDNISVVVVGNFSPDAIIKQARLAFTAIRQIPNSKSQIPNSKFQIPNSKFQIPNPKSQIPNPKSQIPNPKSQIPNPKSRITNPEIRQPIVRESDGGAAVMTLAFAAPGAAQRKEAAVVEVIATYLGEGPTARLFKLFAENDKPPAQLVRVEYLTQKEMSALTLTFGLNSNRFAEVEQAVLAELGRLKQKPLEPKVLRRCHKLLEALFWQRTATLLGQLKLLGQGEVLGSYEWAQNLLDDVKAVTPDDIQRVAKRIFTDKGYVVSVLLPKAKGR